MKRSNFLLFITDQHRADHLGCYGNTVVATPHIDHIASQACVFDRFYVATPLCQPNRASLMTGRMPSVHGVQINGRELSHAELTFVDMLRQSGYRTGLMGKAHLQNITSMPRAWPAPGEKALKAQSRQPHPGRYGQEQAASWAHDPAFDLTLPYYGFDTVRLTIGHADQQQGHWRRWLDTQVNHAEQLIGPDHAIATPEFMLSKVGQAWRTRVPEELYPTRYIADRTCDFLRDRAGDGAPFFVQCSFPDPHHPYTPPGRFWDMYKPEDMVLPANFSSPLNNPPPPIAALRNAARQGTARKSGHGLFACSEREAREAMALNYGNISCVDDAIGRVHDTLKALGLDDNTVIAFTSDHGDMLGDRGLLLKGGLHYTPLVRVPFMWRDTAGQNTPSRTSALAQTTDIASSVLARAGIEAAHGMQGRSMMPVIQRQTDALRQQVLIEEETQRRDFGLSHRLRLRTLLTSRHRLTLYAEETWGELYDLADDPLEQNNLWDNPLFADVRSDMTAALAYEMMDAAETSPYPLFAA